MKKIAKIILSVIMCVCLLAGCGGGDEETGENVYSGILTKIKIGMPLTKIQTLQPDGVTLNWEDDTTIWSINTDTDLMPEVAALIPVDNVFYRADDSIITYFFKTKKGDEELYLNGYSEEVHCLIDRTAAEEYFESKTKELLKKYCVSEGSSAAGTQVGEEGVDEDIIKNQKISASSYDVVFSMTLTYDTVDDVTEYYATKFEIKLTEKEVKGEVAIATPETDK